MAERFVYIISLKFAPGLKKEFEVLGAGLRNRGFNVEYVLSEEYKKLGGIIGEANYITKHGDPKGMIIETFGAWKSKKLTSACNNFKSSSLVLFYNPHPLNPFIARIIKKTNQDVTCVLYLHEPYTENKLLYGFTKATYITLLEFIQRMTIRYMDYVISPSQYSSQIFRKAYPEFKYSNNYIAPLLVPEQNVKKRGERRYFSMVGNANPATNLEKFIELVNYVADHNLGYEFAIISSSNLSYFLRRLNNNVRKTLRIVNNKIITDQEINEVIRDSYAVFKLDKTIMQSGVIPVSFMNSTPVIVRNIKGLAQHVRHKIDGYIVPTECHTTDLLAAMGYVKLNFVGLSKRARESYERLWAETNFDNYYGWLISLLNNNG